MQILMYPQMTRRCYVCHWADSSSTRHGWKCWLKQRKWNKVMSISLRTGFKSRFLYFSSSTHFGENRWSCNCFYSGLFCRLFNVGDPYARYWYVSEVLCCGYGKLLRVDYAKRAVNIDLTKTHIISISIKSFPRNFCWPITRSRVILSSSNLYG